MPAIKVGEEVLTNMFGLEVNPSVLRRICRTVGTDLLLCTKASKVEIKRALAEHRLSRAGHSQDLVGLESLVDSTVMSFPVENLVDVKPLRDVSASTLIELLDEDSWIREVEKHAGVLNVGFDRSRAFGEIFGHLINAGAIQLEILDPYFLAKVLDRAEVVEFLMQEFAQRKLRSLKIRSGSTANRNFTAMTISDKAAAAGRELSRIAAKANFTGSIELQIYKEFHHNRYFITRFLGGEFVFELGLGIDTFSLSNTGEGQVVHVISSVDWGKVSPVERVIRPSENQLEELNLAETHQNLKVMVSS